jgi:hypothetical protein
METVKTANRRQKQLARRRNSLPEEETAYKEVESIYQKWKSLPEAETAYQK